MEILAKTTDQNSKTAQAAKAAFEHNSQYFTHKDLSPGGSLKSQSCTFQVLSQRGSLESTFQVLKVQVHSLPSLLTGQSLQLLGEERSR